MNPQFTHFSYAPTCGIDLLAGGVRRCLRCETTLFGDYAYIEDGGEVMAGEPDSQWGQLALGRQLLPDDAEPAREVQPLCESCSLEAGLL